MSGSPKINIPHVNTQADDFDPNTKLPDFLHELADLGETTRKEATPLLRRACALMDNAALRTAALPQPE